VFPWEQETCRHASKYAQKETKINRLQWSRVVTGKTLVLWVATPCNVSGRYRRFGWKNLSLHFHTKNLTVEAIFSAETSVSTHISALFHSPEEHNMRKECIRSSCFWALSVVLILYNLFHIRLLLNQGSFYIVDYFMTLSVFVLYKIEW
jgi:hypothetical protein